MKTPQLAYTFLVLTCLSFNAFSQQKNELAPGYYVVVAAFSPDKESLAINYRADLNNQGVKVEYAFNTKRNYWYVYIHKSEDLKTAVREMTATRKMKNFSDAWVWRAESTDNVAAVEKTQPEKQTVPATTQPETNINPVVPTDTPEASGDTIRITDNDPIIQYDTMTLENTEVFLSLFNARNNRVVEGKVKVVDTEKNKLIKEVPGNDYLVLPDPKTTSGKLTLICEAFGFRKMQQDISYPMPLADTAKGYIELMGTTFIIYFDLQEYQPGDIATLYNVYFYNDAAIMLPESKFELTSLLQMMRENPDFRILLHGHSNGKQAGRIIKMGKEKEFFSLDGSVNSFGSAKDLSQARAEIIRDWLVENQVSADRIEIKAWGGKKPIHDRNSANAKRNVRVEVEILKNK